MAAFKYVSHPGKCYALKTVNGVATKKGVITKLRDGLQILGSQQRRAVGFQPLPMYLLIVSPMQGTRLVIVSSSVFESPVPNPIP